ncbi:hypothetical protein GUITHDRAFT_162144 [Guillardia theta CCMP2712]|uniref:Uncharacterized protein n=1 Tax=Guillardia theta (strain CCMP2712) TaxID=905079 RepID=L1JLE5_GUITC|nr:hypothetical protein GUITHDRAFT_162144 [Guillardia theta CCMP2712]EKX49336.1 hypothetical protein GUITHDRAFT_162144 [Guillardia theta CCMP2712]|eukprot:XP_005836316.1 hypothetical protein GUITHDRAFT_162144 [Guillardia theta CCMP2712]
MAEFVVPARMEAASQRKAAVVISGIFVALAVVLACCHRERAAELSSVPRGYMDPLAYLASQSHQRFVGSESEAIKMIANDQKFQIPCAFGVRCHIHVPPTYQERTGGAWLGEGRVTGLVPVQTDKAEGPWNKAEASDIPHPAYVWGNVDRATSFEPEGAATNAESRRHRPDVKAQTAQASHQPERNERGSTGSVKQARLHRGSASSSAGQEEKEGARAGSGGRLPSKFDEEEAKIEQSKQRIKDKMAKLMSQYDASLTEPA